MALSSRLQPSGFIRSVLGLRSGPVYFQAATFTSGTRVSGKPQPRDSQTFRLPDGRVLGFAEYGLPDGKPLLYFHGYPASRREPIAAEKEIEKRGIRLISIERPGLGLSTYQPDRRLTDWPDDVKALAQGIGLTKFAVLGASGGGPYAVACARSLPADMLTATGVFAGAPPWSVGAHHMSKSRRRLAYLAEHWPRLLRGLMSAAVGMTKWLVRRAWVQAKIDAWLEGVVKKTKENSGEKYEKMTEEQAKKAREQIFAPMFDHFEQGTAGFLKETQILVRDWGFPFEEVKGKVQIYHGVEDVNTPINVTRIMASQMPNCNLQEFDKDDHYSMGTYMGEAMTKLVLDDENKRV